MQPLEQGLDKSTLTKILKVEELVGKFEIMLCCVALPSFCLMNVEQKLKLRFLHAQG